MQTASADAKIDPAPAFADFASLKVGDQVKLSKLITAADLDTFAAISGDWNPLHMDSGFARKTSFQRRVAHGMLLGSYVSALVGMHLPGAGALWTQQSFRWLAPVFIGDTVTVTIGVTQKSEGTRTVKIEVEAVNQHGNPVMNGEGAVTLLEEIRKNEDLPVCERVALVTGASGGIGAAIAARLAKAGAAVAVNYLRDAVGAEDLCRELAADGCRVMPLKADVTDAESVDAAFDSVRRQFGKPVDVLINNAAAPFTPMALMQTSWNTIQDLLDVSVRGAYYCAKAALPSMIERKSGRIVTIGASFASGPPPPNWGPLVIAKSALAALTRSLAAEFGPSGVRVNMVSPGITETEAASVIPERLRKVQAMQTPLRRLASPDDVAQTVLFLCSEGGSFITGADLPVCGGMRM